MQRANTAASSLLPPWLVLLALLAGCTERRPAPPAGPELGAGDPGGSSASLDRDQESSAMSAATPASSTPPPGLELATLGAGCYWCIEAVLEQVDGVHDVVSGFMGGEVEDPSYEEVCSGRTGHAEVVQVTFDPRVLPYEHLLEWFWRLHDPTTLNRQGADVGTQYRSAIFAHSDAQLAAARASKERLEREQAFDDPIVTEIVPASAFWPADEHHQDYYRNNKEAGYCRVVIAPKLGKLGLER